MGPRPFLWAKSSTARKKVVQHRTFTVTHPFHPLFGQELELVSYSLCWGEGRAYFYDREEQLRSLPASWTNVGPQDVFVELSAGRSPFRLVDLLELGSFLREMRANV